MVIYASTQSPATTQMEIARVLGVDMNKVVCKVKRIGGGFGGKETRDQICQVMYMYRLHLLYVRER
jgi:xanthine dehydrogenase molybdopterin-binding subunit B